MALVCKYGDRECNGCMYCQDHDSPAEDRPLCDSCGDEITNEDDVYGLCDVCKEELVKDFQVFMNSFSEAEREYLNSYYDGKAL